MYAAPRPYAGGAARALTASIQFTLREAYRAESVWLAIRYALAWHDFPEGGMWNDFFSPLNRSDQLMPKVELKEKDSTE